MQEGRLLLFPDIHKDKIAFVYAGDLWLASNSGGEARRITSHPGRELFPKFSPDGKWLAFTGQYDGNFNVYVMPSDGGQPKQLTFYQGRRSRSTTAWASTMRSSLGRPTARASSFFRAATLPTAGSSVPTRVGVEGGLARALLMDKGGLTILFARWQQDRLQPHLPQLPHVEALHRRHGAGHLRSTI